MTEALVDHLSRFGYNLVIEGTLRTAEVPMRSATLLRNRAQEQLFPREGYNGLASEALRDILFGPWTEEERRHYRKLTSKLDYLKTK